MKCEFAEWPCSLLHIPSGLSVDWWNACQEPLTLNTELDLTDKIPGCCLPLVLLTGIQYMTSYSGHLHLHTKAPGSQYVVGCYCGKLIVRVLSFLSWHLCWRGKKFVHSRQDLCDHPLPAFIAVHWQRQHQHHEPLSVMMGCVILLGVFALSVDSRGPIKTAGHNSAVKELWGFSFRK